MGDGNTIEIGDRITNINIPLNISDAIAEGLGQSMATKEDGGMEMNIDISMRVRIEHGSARGDSHQPITNLENEA